MLALPVAFQSLETISRRYAQVVESGSDFELPKFSASDLGDYLESPDALASSQQFGISALERPDHGSGRIVTLCVNNVKRYYFDWRARWRPRRRLLRFLQARPGACARTTLITLTITEELAMPQMHNPAHPGEVLREYLPSDMPVGEIAKRLGVSRQALSAVLNGRAGVSAEMALRLEMATQSPESAPHCSGHRKLNVDLLRASGAGVVGCQA